MTSGRRSVSGRPQGTTRRSPKTLGSGSNRGTVVRLVLAGLVVVAVLFVFVFPTSALWHQHQQIDRTSRGLSDLRRQNADLARDAERLHSDAEVGRIARSQYGMVLPNEQGWAVVPSTQAPPKTSRARAAEASTTTTGPKASTP